MIRVQNLVKTFGEVKAVDNISFDVRAGEIFAFLGPERRRQDDDDPDADDAAAADGGTMASTVSTRWRSRSRSAGVRHRLPGSRVSTAS